MVESILFAFYFLFVVVVSVVTMEFGNAKSATCGKGCELRRAPSGKDEDCLVLDEKSLLQASLILFLYDPAAYLFTIDCSIVDVH